jgi:hypothetical protein
MCSDDHRNSIAAPVEFDVARFMVLCRYPHSTNWADLVAMQTHDDPGRR